jgi:hypothetical protein
VPEAMADLIFENIFRKNNDLRTLLFVFAIDKRHVR